MEKGYDRALLKLNDIFTQRKFRKSRLEEHDNFIKECYRKFPNDSYQRNNLIRNYEMSFDYRSNVEDKKAYFEGEIIDGKFFGAPIDGYQAVCYDYIYRSIKKTINDSYGDVLKEAKDNCLSVATEIENNKFPKLMSEIEDLEKLPRLNFLEFKNKFPNINDINNFDDLHLNKYSAEISNEIDNVLGEIKENDILTESNYEFLKSNVQGKGIMYLLTNYYTHVEKKGMDIYKDGRFNNNAAITVGDVFGLAVIRAKIKNLKNNFNDELEDYNKLGANKLNDLMDYVSSVDNISFCSIDEISHIVDESIHEICLNESMYKNKTDSLVRLKTEYKEYKDIYESKPHDFSYKIFLNNVVCSVANYLSNCEGTKLSMLDKNYFVKNWKDLSMLSPEFGTDKGNLVYVINVGNKLNGSPARSSYEEKYTPQTYKQLVDFRNELGEPCLLSEITEEILRDAINKMTKYEVNNNLNTYKL